jgi:hypothetical protein
MNALIVIVINIINHGCIKGLGSLQRGTAT